MVYNLRFFFSSKCSLFHNSNVFGSCIIHILYTGVLKLKNNSGTKRLPIMTPTAYCDDSVFNGNCHVWHRSGRAAPWFRQSVTDHSYRVRSQVSPCAVCGALSGTGTGVCPSNDSYSRLSTGQTGETWEPPGKKYSFGSLGYQGSSPGLQMVK